MFMYTFGGGPSVAILARVLTRALRQWTSTRLRLDLCPTNLSDERWHGYVVSLIFAFRAPATSLAASQVVQPSGVGQPCVSTAPQPVQGDRARVARVSQTVGRPFAASPGGRAQFDDTHRHPASVRARATPAKTWTPNPRQAPQVRTAL